MDKQGDHKATSEGDNIFRRLIFRQSAAAGDSIFESENVPCNSPVGSFDMRAGGPLAKMALNSSSHGIASMSSEDDYIREPSSILSLQPWIFKRSGPQKDGGKNCAANRDMRLNKATAEMDLSVAQASPRSVGLGGERGRGRSSLRSRPRCKDFIKPVSSAENSLIPQLYNENFEIEEYVFSPFSPTAESARPFIVTDGRKVINRSSGEHLDIPFNMGLHNGVYQGGRKTLEMLNGVTPLPDPRKRKQKSRVALHERSDTGGFELSKKQSHSKGSNDRVFLFSIGLCAGIVYSDLKRKTEVDSLKDMLKRSENLVQDLQEELEMRESLTVKELSGEGSQGNEDENNRHQSPTSEPMSKIEAELEAELEKLHFNVTSSCLEGRISAMSEVDPELIGDIVHGELKADLLHGDSISHDTRSSSTTGCGHAAESMYPVSPRALSLRLHEVIQQRLEDRIKELETAVAHGQKQLQMFDSNNVFFSDDRTLSNSDVEVESSSNKESPTLLFRTESNNSIGDGSFVQQQQPLCLNLCGDALDAYEEACQEFACCDLGNVKEEKAAEVCEVNHSWVDRSLMWGMENGSAMKLAENTWEHMLVSSESYTAGDEIDGVRDDHEEEEEDDDDDDGRLLIQQIVERSKQGSVAADLLIHAQRLLLSDV